MSDLISRADALEAIKLLPVQLDAETVQRCIEAVSNIPSEQITSDVRHGKWIYTGQKNIYGGVGLKCSECGDNVMVQHVEDKLYCRHCGARMDAE